jgi:hypothetical protein
MKVSLVVELLWKEFVKIPLAHGYYINCLIIIEGSSL